MNYTITVAQAGPYDVTLTAASAGGGGPVSVSFSANGAGTGTVWTGGTGGWETFQTVTVHDVRLAAGTQVMTVSSDGGFNLDCVTLTPSASLPTPTGLTATAGSRRVALTWNAFSGAISYNLYRSTTSGGEGQTPVQTDFSSPDTGLTNGTTYYYQLSAVDSYGVEGARSAEVSATPVFLPPTLTTIAVSPASATVSGGGTQAFTAIGYDQDGNPLDPQPTFTWSVDKGGTMDSGSGVFTAGTHNAVGTVQAASGTVSGTATVTVQGIPDAPTGLTATAGTGHVGLIWASVSGADSYVLYRGTSPGGEGATPVQTGLSATSCTDSGLANGTTYYYTVAAVNSSGTSDPSGEASATPIAVPTGLSAAPDGAQVVLSWLAAAGATSYTVRYGTSSGSYTQSVSGITGLTATITGLRHGPPTYFVVEGVNAGGQSDLSAEISATLVSVLPGKVEAEDYDGGGEGVGYHTDYGWNKGGAYRNDSISISADPGASNGYCLSYIGGDQWMNYTVTVQKAGLYDVTVEAASAGGGGPLSVSFSRNGASTGTFWTAGTGGWGVWQPFTVQGVWLAAGPQVMHVWCGGGYNLDCISVVPSTLTTVVHVLTGAWQPNPAAVGQDITSAVTTTLDSPYQSPAGDHISQSWQWDTTGVYQSADGTSGSFTPYNGDYAIVWTQGSALTNFTGNFADAGYYIIKVTATLTYHDDTLGVDIAQYHADGYIGGSASDLASTGNNSSSVPRAVMPHSARRPRDAAAPAGAGGVPVIGIMKLQYAISPSTTFKDALDLSTNPPDVDVTAGTQVVFKAIPSVPGTSFPAGQPVWSGVTGGVANGDTYTITLTTLNKTVLPTDFQQVTATFGPSAASATILVRGISIAVTEYATGSQATLQRVKVVRDDGSSFVNGSGTTMAVTVSPVNGFSGGVVLDMDRSDTTQDIFGNIANATDAGGNTVHYAFYDPLQTPTASNYSEPSDQPSYFSLDFSNQKPKTITLEAWLDRGPATVMAAGSYQATIFGIVGSTRQADHTITGGIKTGNEFSLPIDVTDTVAPKSVSNSSNASPNYEVNSIDYTHTSSPGATGPFRKVIANKGNKTSTASGYSAFQATVIPPLPTPSNVNLVEAMNTGGTVAGDALDIYTGGSAYDRAEVEYSPLDIGISVGHTGAGGHYKVTCNPASVLAGTVYTDGQGDTVTNVYVLPGQAITMTLEVWGFPSSTGAVPEDYIVFKLSGPGLYGTVGGNDIQISDYVTTDPRPLPYWDHKRNIRFKRVTSIAQTLYGTSSLSPNVPPNAFPADQIPQDAGLYTTGSFVSGVPWTAISLYDSRHGTQVSWDANNTSLTYKNGSYPGSPYVLWDAGTTEVVRTLGQ